MALVDKGCHFVGVLRVPPATVGELLEHWIANTACPNNLIWLMMFSRSSDGGHHTTLATFKQAGIKVESALSRP